MLLGWGKLRNVCARTGRCRRSGWLQWHGLWEPSSAELGHGRPAARRKVLKARSQNDWPGFYIMLLLLLVTSVHCSHSCRQNTSWWFEQTDSLFFTHCTSWKMVVFWLGCGGLQQCVVNRFKWESFQMLTVTLVHIINKWIDFIFIS